MMASIAEATKFRLEEEYPLQYPLLKPYGYDYTMPTVDGADSLSLAHTHMHTHALPIRQFLQS
jgi:hypothetical protein